LLRYCRYRNFKFIEGRFIFYLITKKYSTFSCKPKYCSLLSSLLELKECYVLKLMIWQCHIFHVALMVWSGILWRNCCCTLSVIATLISESTIKLHFKYLCISWLIINEVIKIYNKISFGYLTFLNASFVCVNFFI
jgi:hypothetical protein